jgi:hypothetical protein
MLRLRRALRSAARKVAPEVDHRELRRGHVWDDVVVGIQLVDQFSEE